MIFDAFKRQIKAPFTKLFIERMTDKAIDQDEFGFEKYGKYLDPMDNYDWLNMATEEFVDLGKYLEAERVKRDAIVLNIVRNTSIMQASLDAAIVPDEVRKELNRYLYSIQCDMKILSKNHDGLEKGKAGNN